MTRRHLAGGGLASVRQEHGDVKPPSPTGIRQGVSVIASVSSVTLTSTSSSLDTSEDHHLTDKKTKVTPANRLIK